MSSTYHQDHEEEEKDIGDVMELEPEVLRNERQGGILGCSNLVPGIASEGIPFVVFHFRW